VDVAVTGAEEHPTVDGSTAPADAAAASGPADGGSPDAGLVCSVCGFEAFPGDLFCENCSAPLPGTEATGAAVEAAASAAPAPEAGGGSQTQPIEESTVSSICANCGGTTFQDGYCTNCGAPAVKERDHFQEQPAGWVAAVSDRGIRHHRNEDAMALSALPEPGSRAVLVVCDGVSSSMDPDIASLGAARAARDVLTTSRPGSPSIAGRISAWTELLGEAAAAANEQAVSTYRNPTNRPGERQNNAPSCTFVAAVVDGPVNVVGWVGDSRAYWLPDGGPAEMLSVDDSWASEAINAGMPRAQAETAPQAHAITRWLGVDSPDFTPRCSSITPTGSGWLLVCSDGLWNYCSAAPEMGTLVARTASDQGSNPMKTAAALVDWANAQGGMDNITVALARLNPPPVT
jgi:serine/threonine protein phosphatase PrpC